MPTKFKSCGHPHSTERTQERALKKVCILQTPGSLPPLRPLIVSLGTLVLLSGFSSVLKSAATRAAAVAVHYGMSLTENKVC